MSSFICFSIWREYQDCASLRKNKKGLTASVNEQIERLKNVSHIVWYGTYFTDGSFYFCNDGIGPMAFEYVCN